MNSICISEGYLRSHVSRLIFLKGEEMQERGLGISEVGSEL